MYKTIRDAFLHLLALPKGPPEPPPGGAVVRTFTASPKYLSYRLLALWIGVGAMFLVAGALAIGAVFEGWPLAVGAAIVAATGLVILIVGYVTNRIEFDLRYYILTDRSLRIREGVFLLRESTLTFANVQNLRIRKGPIQQLFGIADVLVDTAGGAGGMKNAEGQAMERGHRGTIQGIEDPTEVRDLVLNLLKKYRDAGLGDPDDPEHAKEEPLDRFREILQEVKLSRKSVTGDR